ncbi:uncharacterized protein LOC113047453 [Carassius auratus]|uniref:Uncharacterized protein LOC113047453 n=1 Tax=Carassius auratus TaxID=7957 RepID=A0A6P6JXH1_CARAU|nr:uncharacterized protein LOC113047453 [Carassius auratus]
MMLEGAKEFKNKKDEIKKTQALSSDYEQTGYDRGHLYPNSFQCGEGCKATFTLTNAAPMDACFNRIHWKLWEGYLKTFLINSLHDEEATAYIVTGTVPGQDKIPQSGDRDLKRVTIPSHIWTAVCYEHKEHDKSFSFGYIGLNQPEFNIELMSVSEINKQLSKPPNPPVKIFHDDCFSGKPASEEAMKQFLNQIKLPEHLRFQMSKSAQNSLLSIFDAISSDSTGPSNEPTVLDVTATLAFDSSTSHLTSTETLKRRFDTSCVVTDVKKRHRSDKQKRQVSEGSESIECRLVPEKSVDGKSSADGSPCSCSEDNGYKCSTQESKSKSCCSTPCLYQEQLKGYRCYSGKTQIECSPQYSLITVKGNRCRDDHPCATYGKDYYWCFINDKSWEHCSPPLWGSRAKDGKYCRSNYACAKYDKNDPWCYTDDKNWNSCCTSDDYFSAVNYKTCKPDHPCGYYGKTYLWCNTTDGKWNYCCKEFKK